MKLIAHRGKNDHKYKENTTEALLDCLNKDYIAGVELDIRLTKDNKFVISHNSSYVVLGIDRKFISATNIDDIKKDGYSALEDFLDSINNNKIIIIEIKKEIGDYQNDLNELRKICKKYSDLNLWFCSFCYKLVNDLKKECKFPVGLLISDIINKNKDIKTFDFLSLSRNSYNDIKTNKIIVVWPINKKEQIKQDYEYIITDKAYLLYA